MTSRGLFTAGAGVIALHVLDDNFVQPQPGVPAGDHLVSGLVPLALLALAAWAYGRRSGGARGVLALAVGLAGVAAGIEAAHYTRTLGPSGDDFTGLLALAAGVVLLGLGAVTLVRTRRRTGNLLWRGTRRGLLAAGGVLATMLVVLPLVIGYVSVHVGRAVVPAPHLGAAHEDVAFTTADGLRLHGWYVPSRNGAAVIAFPGRKGPQAQTRMLVRHGYGVLLFDRRGEGESDGEPNAFGWGGTRDIEAAAAYLRRRPDVEPGRIGGIGLSVGGELMLETAAKSGALAAVVSEGAGARAFSDDQDQEVSTVEHLVGAVPAGLKTASLAVFSNRLPPPNLAGVIGRIAPRPVLLIAAPNTQNGERLNRRYARAGREPKALWEIPESSHVGGIRARPAEYERRVVGFFDAGLRR